MAGKRAFSPREVLKMTYKPIPWDGEWQEVFGNPDITDTWFISGSSASGKSSFVLQLSKKLCEYGTVLYVSLEEGVGMSFHERIRRFHMEEQQGRFRIELNGSVEVLRSCLKRKKSPRFVVIDSFQFAQSLYGWDYQTAVDLTREFPKKCFIFISQEAKSEPLGKPAMRLKYLAGVKVRVVAYKAMCQGRFIGEAGATFPVWKDGIIQTTNNI